jgi:hypothetical protein
MGGGGTGTTLGGVSVETSGGVIETNGSYTTHTFVSPGPNGFEDDTTQTFVAAENLTGVLFFVIGGGGGGGYAGGGGSGGAVTNAITGSTITVNAGTYPVTLGGGGQSNSTYSEAGSNSPNFPAPESFASSKATDGSRRGRNSVWNGYTGLGGGAGGVETGPSGYNNNPTAPYGNPGGSGGGGAKYGSNGPQLGGPGIQPGQSQGPNGTNYGSAGGSAVNGGADYTGAGGGGIGGAGTAASSGNGGVGGVGLKIPICPPNYGTPGPSPGRWLGGGGGSSKYPGSSWAGGSGGGNNGNLPYASKSTIYTTPVNPGTGGGGGAGTNYNDHYSTRGNPGIVVIAYPTP